MENEYVKNRGVFFRSREFGYF